MSLSTPSRTQPRPAPSASDPPGSPAATRRRRAVWRDPRLVIGVALVAASALVGATVLGGGDPGVGLWATRAAMVEGQRVTAADLVRREVRFSDPAGADRYLPAERPLPEGAVLSRSIGAGELLPSDAVAERGAPGLVEVPVRVAPAALPATVEVGAVVDVWVTPQPGASAGPGATAERVLDDVPVLRVAGASGALGAGAERQVIVGLGGDQVGDLPDALAAMSTGAVVLTRTP